jgi:hypothetical protein
VAVREGSWPQRLLDLDAATYRPHPLHGPERIWTETNCAVDVWIEVLASLDLDPVAGTAFTVSAGFEGDQWTFTKYPIEDLRTLYGIEVVELNVWRPVADHLVEHLGLGHLLTVEADAWHLPDTAGVSYRLEHTKTTVVPNAFDPDGPALGYFHNAGYFEVEGDDAAAVVGSAPPALPPYVEVVKVDGARVPHDLVDRVIACTLGHLERRPAADPVAAMAGRIRDDLPWLAVSGPEIFHGYAFGTCRQFGAGAELAASLAAWLEPHVGGLDRAVDAFGSAAEAAKTLQFVLARRARGRSGDLDGPLSQMGAGWARGIEVLEGRLGA